MAEYKEFQFLMVRLKGRRIKRFIYAKEKISIPYGAIKSQLTELFCSFSWNISIPYGAIKSVRNKLMIQGDAHFNSLWCD